MYNAKWRILICTPRKGVYIVVSEKTSLKRADFPEQVGVSSKDILAFIEDLSQSGIEAHSFMVLRHGKVAFETWRDPYTPDTPHIMFSVSKSVTSIAAGFAIEEGYFSLDTKLLDVFPEYRPQKHDAMLEKITVRHLLTMTAGKNVSLLADKSKNQWLKDYFEAPWYADPDDDLWMYISENTYMICAIIHRTTGMSVIDFLTPRLFEPLGYARVPFWETDADGVEAGGWGLYLTTEELAKFILCCRNGGKYEGKQVIPAHWIEEATKTQAANLRFRDEDNRAGYGYFFWKNGVVPNSYRADGMFSQFGIIFEDFDAEFIITSCEINEQKTRDCIWRHFPAAFIDDSDDKGIYTALSSKLHMEPLKELPMLPHSPLESMIAGRPISFKKPKLLNTINFPVSMLPLASVYMSADRAGNIDNVVFGFSGDECTMDWDEGKAHNRIVCGMDGIARNTPMHLAGINYTARSTAAWEDTNTLSVWCRPLEGVCQRRWKFIFKEDNHVDAIPASVPNSKSLIDYLIDGMDEFVDSKLLSRAAQKASKNVYKLVEPVHKGTIS